MDFLQRTPFFRLLLPFLLGTVLYQYVEFSGGTLYAVFCGGILLIISSFILRTPKLQYRFRWLFGCGIFLLIFASAFFRNSLNEKENTFDHLNQKGIFRIELAAAPVEKAKSYLCKVEILQYIDSTHWTSARGKAILYIQKDSAASKLLFGDRLLVRAEFSSPEKALNPDAFDYAVYLKRQGIMATCYIPATDWHHTDHSTGLSIQRAADKCRQNLLNIYRKFQIEGDEFAVLAALTLGFTDDLQPDLRSSYSASGAMHILSVSGMHVAVVYMVILFLLSFLSKNKKQKIIRTIIILLFLWAYAFLTGLSPAAVRATLMFSFIVVASCLERKSQIYNTIFMSMLLMLLYNPSYLFDVGFQLSYSAVLSILFFQPIVNKIYTPSNKQTRLVWDLLAVSVAAQLGTTPFTLYYFHQFPNYFLLTNLVAIPVSSVVIYLAIALLTVSFIPYLSVAVAFLLKWSTWLLNYLIVSIQHLPHSLSYISLDIKQLALAMLATFCLSAYFFTKKYVPLLVGSLAILGIGLFSLQANYQTLQSKRMIVYAGQKNTHISFIHRNQNYVFTTDSAEIERIANPYWQNHKLDRPHYLLTNNWCSEGFVSFEGKQILILDSSFLKKQTMAAPLPLDFLIIGKKLKPNMEQVLQCFQPQKIIVDKSISKWYTEKIREVCKQHHIAFYSVAENGAFILNITD